jgi:hypothetical protein
VLGIFFVIGKFLMSARVPPVKKKTIGPDPKKELVFKGLSRVLQDAGFEVRREKLRQGHGWRVISGACRHEQRNLIFVDRKLSQDDQISFLRAKCSALNVEVTACQSQVSPVGGPPCAEAAAAAEARP